MQLTVEIKIPEEETAELAQQSVLGNAMDANSLAEAEEVHIPPRMPPSGAVRSSGAVRLQLLVGAGLGKCCHSKPHFHEYSETSFKILYKSPNVFVKYICTSVMQ